MYAIRSYYGFARRDTLSFSVLGRDVSFSTGNRASTLQLAPGLEHQFSPLVKLLVEPGLALGRASSVRPGRAPQSLLLPTSYNFV